MTRKVQPKALSSLSPRQKDVARLVSEGLNNHEIAGRLGLKVKQVEINMWHLYEFFDLSGRQGHAKRVKLAYAISDYFDQEQLMGER